MQINQISQALQPKTSQIKSNVDNNSSNKAFELMLQEMIQSTGNQDTNSVLGLDSNSAIDSTNLISGLNGTDLTSNLNTANTTEIQNKTINGLENLSLNSQKIAQMLELMQMSSSNNVISSISSDDDSGDDSNSLDTTSSTTSLGGTDDISQLLQTILQTQNTDNSNAQDSNDLTPQIQQSAANIKL